MISTVYQLVNHMEADQAEKTAIQYYDEAKGGVVSICYGQYAQDIRRAAGLLLHRKPDIKGQKVCLLARNGYDYLVNLLSVLLAGGVLVPLNLQKNWDEIQYEIDLVEPAYILHDGEFAEREPALTATYGDKLLPMDGYKTSQWSERCSECEDVDALSVILFTSGTTGRWDTSKFRSFSVLPMFHVAALTSSISWAIMGNTVNLCNDLKHFYRDLAAMDSEVMAVVPVLLQSIYRDVKRGRRDRLGSLKVLTCGAASMDAETMSDLVKAGFFICQMYGLTETVGDGTWNNSQDPADIHSVGLCDPKREYKLEDGELCIRGNSVMMGYYKDPEGTAEVLDADGWLHTGDLARIDERGFVFLTGRKKNVIILGSGENVSPEELEALLNQCEAVTESLVREENGKIVLRGDDCDLHALIKITGPDGAENTEEQQAALERNRHLFRPARRYVLVERRPPRILARGGEDFAHVVVAEGIPLQNKLNFVALDVHLYGEGLLRSAVIRLLAALRDKF